MRRLWQRVYNMLAHGTVTSVNDAGGTQKLQLRVGAQETHDNIRSIQQFGLASTPPAGSDVTLVFFAGERSQGLAIATNHECSRPVNQEPGEATVFNAHGMTIALTAAGIVINPNGTPVSLQGDLHVTGQVTAGFGGDDAVSLQTHQHGKGAAAAGTSSPSPGT